MDHNLFTCSVETDNEGRELTMHGTAPFPVACYADDLSAEAVAWHWHEEMEVILVTEGCASVGADAQRYILKCGDGVFINSGVLHCVEQEGTQVCRLHSLVFHPRVVGGSADSIFWQKYLQPMTSDENLKCVLLEADVRWKEQAGEFFESAWQACMRGENGFEFVVRAGLSRMFALLVQNLPAARTMPSEHSLRNAERIKLMLQFIQKNYSEELSLAQIAESAMLSVSECLRCFRETIDDTPMQYVTRYRIQAAAELLSSTKIKIADIATSCGFQDMSYFAKSFREVKECTPSAYRAKQLCSTKSTVLLAFPG